MMDTFDITLPLPPSTNNLYATRGNRRVLTSVASSYKDVAIVRMRERAFGWRPAKKARFKAEILLYFADNRRRDIANCEKIVIDAMAVALEFDDCQIDDLHLRRAAIDSTNPRCVVRLSVL